MSGIKKRITKSSCVACPYSIQREGSEVYLKLHFQKNHNYKNDGWRCKLENCRIKDYENAQKCRVDRIYIRVEDKARHETEEQFEERNKEKIDNSVTCMHCGKKFNHRPTKHRHQTTCKLVLAKFSGTESFFHSCLHLAVPKFYKVCKFLQKVCLHILHLTFSYMVINTTKK